MMKMIHFSPALLLVLLLFACEQEEIMPENPAMPKIVGFNGQTFVDENCDPFFPWGYNYTNPQQVGLIEDHWHLESLWEIIEEDFAEMKSYAANTVRIHLQYSKFMIDPNTPNPEAFSNLRRLVEIAEANNLYLIITGLAAYRACDTHSWYLTMEDSLRWETHKLFWKTVAKTVHNSPAVFAYDLINEPVVGHNCDTLNGCNIYPPNSEFGGYQFVQRITLNPDRPYWQTLAAWTDTLTAAIKEEDNLTMITVGLLPLGPIHSHSPHVDILSTHIYPRSSDLQSSIDYIKNNQSNKPFLIEETANLYCDTTELKYVLTQAEGYYHGVIGHYFGKKLEEYDDSSIVDAIHKQMVLFFINNNPN